MYPVAGYHRDAGRAAGPGAEADVCRHDHQVEAARAEAACRGAARRQEQLTVDTPLSEGDTEETHRDEIYYHAYLHGYTDGIYHYHYLSQRGLALPCLSCKNDELTTYLVDPDSMPQATQWSSKSIILVGQAGHGNASSTEILITT